MTHKKLACYGDGVDVKDSSDMPKRVVETDKRRVPLNLRTTEDTRARIEEAAKQSGRTLGQEIETRIEQSFLMDKILGEVALRIRAATIQMMASMVDGPENLSTGIRVAQILSFYSLPDDDENAIAAVARTLPALMKKKPLPFEGTVTEFNEVAMFEAAFIPGSTLEIEHGRIKKPKPVEAGRMATPEQLEGFKAIDHEGDLFRSVIAGAKGMGSTDNADVLDNKKPRTHKKKS